MDEISGGDALGKQWAIFISQHADPGDGKAELDIGLDQSFDDADC